MGDGTGISWTDASWNPIRGCSRTIAEGAKQSGCGDQSGGGCYAERMAGRFCGHRQPYEGLVRITPKGGRWTGEVRMVPEHLADPIRWKKPRRIFVNSMSDLFHEKLNNEQIAAVFGVMAAAPRHTFQVLTKRAKRMREWFAWLFAGAVTPSGKCFEAARGTVDFGSWYRTVPQTWPLPNVWLGVSVENQAAANERIPELLATPAAVRFLSCEPLLGDVDLTLHGGDIKDWDEDWRYDTLRGAEWGGTWRDEEPPEATSPHLDWIIAGCESGPDARDCDVAWLRSLRNQCREADVPFFLKQAVETDLGTCGDLNNPNGDRPCGKRITAHVVSAETAAYSCDCTVEGSELGAGVPLGAGDGSRRKAGGLIELPYLDGVQHAAIPRVP